MVNTLQNSFSEVMTRGRPVGGTNNLVRQPHYTTHTGGSVHVSCKYIIHTRGSVHVLYTIHNIPAVR